MALFKSDICAVVGIQPPVTASQAGIVIASIGSAELGTDLSAGDVVALCHLPAGHQPVNLILETESLDGGSAITLTAGILNAAEDDIVAGTEFVKNSTVAQAGGVARANEIGGLSIAPVEQDRILAVKISTAAATAVAGTLRGKLLYCENP